MFPNPIQPHQAMTQSPTQFAASALAAIKELGSINVPFAELDPRAPASVENVLANRSGIDPETDLVSIPGAWLHLHLKLQASRESLGGGLLLLGSNAGRVVVSPVTALARIAMEASAVSLWLCSNSITWEERLRRFSQIHLKAVFTCLKVMGYDPRDRPDPSTVSKNINLSIEECHSQIDWVKARGWTCSKGKRKGKEPTIRTWAEEVPTYTSMMKEASAAAGLPNEELRSLYAIFSASVHTNPVTVIGGSREGELLRLASAPGAIATALGIYGRAWIQVASWCGVPRQDGALRNLSAVVGVGAALDPQ